MGLEQYENNYTTTLNGAIDNSTTSITVTAGPSTLVRNFRIKIDNEIILVGNASGTSFTNCTRGAEGTSAVSHSDAASVKHILTAGALYALDPDPIRDTFGTPDTAYEFNSSSFTGLTQMGTPDTEDADTTISGHYYVKDNDSTLVGRYASVSTPFTVVAKLSEADLNANYKYAQVFVGVGTPGKLVSIGPIYSDGSSVAGRVWTSPGDGGPAVITPTTTVREGPAHMPWYLAVRVASSTDASYYASRDGRIWYLISANRNDSLTIASAGVCVGDYGGTSVHAAFDYLRIWNSTKTFQAFT